MSSQQGYYRFPTIHNNKIVFVSEDDLWSVNLKDPRAIRLTTNLSQVSHPLLSPDGKWIAYVGTEDGNTEVYIMPSDGGPSTRVTYDGNFVKSIAGWDGNNIIYATNRDFQQFGRVGTLYSINMKGGESKSLGYGIASNISSNLDGIVLGRNTADPARWKRYKGGTAGELWICKGKKGKFKKLINLKGNMANPMWVGSRIYFISDHDGIGNIYSCLSSGRSLKQHTFHKNYYARNASTDGKSIVYHSGSQLHLLNIEENLSICLYIQFNSSQIQRSRKFVTPNSYLESVSMNKNASAISIISRGKSFCMENWSGPVHQQGDENRTRYQKSKFLNDGKRLVMVSDKDGSEKLEIHSIEGRKRTKVINGDVGRPYEIKVSPVKDHVVLSNHKNQLLFINLRTSKIEKIDQSKYSVINGFNWSPDGKYIAYQCSIGRTRTAIKIYDIEKKETHTVTNPVRHDFSPVFDSKGKYLAFLSGRIYNPVYDNLHFDLGFPKGEKPYIIVLNKKTESPFFEIAKKEENNNDKKKEKSKEEKEIKTEIDFDGIEDRILSVPTTEGMFDGIGFADDKLFYSSYDPEGTVHDIPWYDLEPGSKSILKYYDFNAKEEKIFMNSISSFQTSFNSKSILIRIKNKIRILDASSPPSKESLSIDKFNKISGMIDLDRVRVSIIPIEEWKQMYSDAWRLQRDFFWTRDMSGINWKKIHDRYLPLVDRVSTRDEFSDLVWEMQGELGTSHCYEFGGDYKPRRNYNIGFLGADFKYCQDMKCYEIVKIIKGDLWSGYMTSPMLRPGLNINEGMYLKSISGINLSRTITPNKCLVNQINKEVQLTILDEKGKNKRNVTVKTIPNEGEIRYRDWVENNREYVHKKTKGKVGYVHVPDMSPFGYSEFHRYFLTEIEYDSLIVDVRFNGGGHVSQLILEKLARKRLGYDQTRWMGAEPFPGESVAGPIISITNEYAGSDGDIFSHSFKLMKLGKLIGKRTWGGVIGIWPRNLLVDGTITTQPEFSFWFKDVEWDVENYGTDVDIEIDIKPEDYQKQKDPQLDRGILEALKKLKKNPVKKPSLSKNRPNLKLPK